MHAVSTKQIADILHYNDNGQYFQTSRMSYISYIMKMYNSKIWFANNKFNLLREIKRIFHDISRAFSWQKLSQTWGYAFNYTGY